MRDAIRGRSLFSRLCTAAAALAAAALPAMLSAACPAPNQGLSFDPLPDTDLRPPALIEAGPAGARRFVLRFDEAVTAVRGSFAVEPAEIGPIDLNAGFVEGADGSGGRRKNSPDSDLNLDFAADMRPGADYKIAGEVSDAKGNTSRLILTFTGWNARPASLRVSEVQTGRNSSQTKPHRDFLELLCAKAGNLGGVEVAWASTQKLCRCRFPAAEIKAGDLVVLHLAPEGLAGEIDESGADTTVSGGTDSSPGGRDFWTKEGGLPDSSGAVAVYERPGGAPVSGFFYGELTKEGALGTSKLGTLVSELGAAGQWPLAGGEPCWEDAYRWKASGSRSICLDPATGQWYVTASSGQSPGEANPPAP